MEQRHPQMSVQPANIAAFITERGLFLTDFVSFRTGKFNAGSTALAHLTAMYYCLPSAKHFDINEKGAEAFLDGIDALERELSTHLQDNHINPDSKYINPVLVKKMNHLMREFQRILVETGYAW